MKATAFVKGAQKMYEIFEQLLHKKGVTPYRVAKDSGVTQTALSNWKSGKSIPSLSTLQKIADYFGVTVDYLMTGESPTEPAKPELNERDRRDIAKDMERIREKLKNKEDGPASFDGEDISDESAELLLAQIESMLGTIKLINKEKYNPNKNKHKK